MLTETERIKILHALHAMTVGFRQCPTREDVIKHVVQVGDDLVEDLQLDHPREEVTREKVF